MGIDVKHLAKLARLRIEEEKLPAFEKDMQNIVNMVEQMPSLTGDATGLDPNNPMQLREDICEPGKYTRKEVLANAPKMQAGCVVVPKTIE
jgi:aspartyl-tRNA(Asn)/glutamyl-tRNA(Gln) amidotransferase subunit C